MVLTERWVMVVEFYQHSKNEDWMEEYRCSNWELKNDYLILYAADGKVVMAVSVDYVKRFSCRDAT